MTGVIACAAVLVAASVFGVVWKNRNGRIRPVATAAAPDRAASDRAAPVSAAPDRAAPVSSVASAARAAAAAPAAPDGLAAPGALAASAGGPAAGGPVAAAASSDGTLTETELGRPLGSRATLVQFSTAFCAPCRATRVILADVAGRVDGVAHVEIDAESHLDLVRRLDIRRTPTVLVLGPDGRITQRGSGQPRKADVLAVISGL